MNTVFNHKNLKPKLNKANLFTKKPIEKSGDNFKFNVYNRAPHLPIPLPNSWYRNP